MDSESSSQDNKKQKLGDTKATPEAKENDDTHIKPKEGKKVSTITTFFDKQTKQTEAP